MRRLLIFLSFSPVLVFLWSDDGCAQYYRQQGFLQRRFTLYGTLELDYERSWAQGSPAVSLFTQNYELGVRGFVIDPRLVNFDVSGSFTDVAVSDGGQGYTLKGARLYATLLERLPPRLLTSWRYIPNPIILRFNHYTGPQDYTNYGVTFRYGMPDEVVAIRRQEKPGVPIIFPTTFFDYDRYEYKFGDSTNKSDIYSLRSFLSGKTYDYSLLLSDENQTGDTELKRTVAELQPNYRFFNPESGQQLYLNNLLRYDKIDERKTVAIRSIQNYMKPYGQDRLQLIGTAGYTSVSADSDITSYDATATVDYTKVYSPRFTNVYTATVGFGQVDSDTNHFERLIDTYTLEISRYLRSIGGAFIGMNQNGFEYGLDAYLATKTAVFARLGYSLASLQPNDGKTVQHRFSLDSSGPIIGTLSFSTSIQYVILDEQRDADVTLEEPGTVFINPSFTQYNQVYTANLFWYLFKTSFAVGGTYTVTDTDFGDGTVKNNFTSLQASITRSLTRNTFLNIYTTWTKDSLGTKTLEIRPRLSWARVFTSFDVEYDYRKITGPDFEATTDHRVYARFVRRFFRDFFIR